VAEDVAVRRPTLDEVFLKLVGPPEASHAEDAEDAQDSQGARHARTAGHEREDAA
jgi:hypothetical protein